MLLGFSRKVFQLLLGLSQEEFQLLLGLSQKVFQLLLGLREKVFEGAVHSAQNRDATGAHGDSANISLVEFAPPMNPNGPFRFSDHDEHLCL